MPPKKTKTNTTNSKPPTTHHVGKASSSKTASTPGKKALSTAKPVKKPASQASQSSKSSTSGKKEQKTTKKSASNKELSKSHKAAVVIQRYIRRYLAKIELDKLKKKKKEYEEELEKIQRQAWLDMVQRQREEDEKQRKREEEERKRRREEQQWRKTILEAAFDGDLDIIRDTIHKAERCLRDSSKLQGEALNQFINVSRMKLIECCDANGNSVLSEASAGGDIETVTYLLQNDASVNSQGHYNRTPLYRAAFGGHFDAVKLLLECGGDPRILDSDGMTASEVAPVKEIIELLMNWDINQTEKLIEDLQKKEDRKAVAQKDFSDMLMENVKKSLKTVEKEYEAKQKMLQHANEELAKRIEEHDKCVASGYDKLDVTLKAIHIAEEELIRVQLEEKSCREKLDQVRLEWRENAQLTGEEVNDFTHVKHHIRELDDVLMRDVGDKIKQSNKWPLLIDTSSQAVTFLKYRDTNYVNVLNPRDVEVNSLRMALLGAIRYGKPFVLDMMEINMMDFIHERFEEIQCGLYNDLISQNLLHNDKYLSLIRANDGDEYSKDKFLKSRVDNFKLIIITKMWHIPKEWAEILYAIKIIIPEV